MLKPFLFAVQISKYYNQITHRRRKIIKMRSKIRLLLILSFLCRPILSSYSSGTVTLELHAFTEAIKLSNGKSSGGLGHSFMKIHNEKNVNVQIGYIHFNRTNM